MAKKKNPKDLTGRNEEALKNKIAVHHIQFKKFKRDAQSKIAALDYELRAMKKQLDVQKVLLKRHNWVVPVKKK